MGYLEIITKEGVKYSFTDAGLDFSLITSQLDMCMACNDPRLLTEGNYKRCVGCGCMQ